MQMTMRRFCAAACLIIAFCALARAEDASGLREELLDLRAMVSSLETPQAAAGGGDATALVSAKKKGAIQIGGEANIDILWKSRDDNTHHGDKVNSTQFTTNSANLRFKISANQNSYLYLKMDLDDFFDDTNNPDADDLLEEVKFVFNNIRNTGWGAIFGKGEVPYGQDKTLGILQSYHHNDGVRSSEGPVFVLAGGEGAADGAPNPYANVGNVAHPGEVDNVFQVGLNYRYKNLLKLEFSVFQNADGPGNNGVYQTGMHEDRRDDTLFFNSFAARVWIIPTDGLRLQGSVIREFNKSSGDSDTFGTDAMEEQWAASFGFTYDFHRVPIQLFGEYQHGWNWNYDEDYKTNTYQLGGTYQLTESGRIGIMGEWLSINNDGHDEDYTRAVLNYRYTLDSGIHFMFEYAYEWYDGDFNDAADRYRDGHFAAFRTGWAF